jgi:hypothetical protein
MHSLARSHIASVQRERERAEHGTAALWGGLCRHTSFLASPGGTNKTHDLPPPLHYKFLESRRTAVVFVYTRNEATLFAAESHTKAIMYTTQS